MTRKPDALDVVGQLYDAALDPEKWPVALKALQTVFHGAGTMLYSVDRDNKIPFLQSVDMAPEGLAEYARP
jgi:hypothetical protein